MRTFLKAILMLVFSRSSAADSCTSGPCVVSIVGANISALTSYTSPSYTPFLTAVGCFNQVTISFEISKAESSTPLAINFCERQSTGVCLNKGSGGGDDWIRSVDFARICCSMAPQDRDAAAAALIGKPVSSETVCKGYESNNYYDIYTCAELSTAQIVQSTTYLTVASVSYIPPFGADLTNGGRTELCFDVLDDKRTPRPPTCLKIQAWLPAFSGATSAARRREPFAFSVRLSQTAIGRGEEWAASAEGRREGAPERGAGAM